MGNREPSLELRAYAKINLGLDITGKREDGYHDLKTIMQQIDLYDTIRLYAEAESGGSGEKGQILISCSDSLVPSDERNLAYKAARLLFRDHGFSAHRDRQGNTGIGRTGRRIDGCGGCIDGCE